MAQTYMLYLYIVYW